MQRNPVVWFEIYVQDMSRAQKFYESVLGVELSDLPMPEGMEETGESGDQGEMQMKAFPMEMDGPGAAGALIKMDGMPAGQNSVLVYFGCEDCAVEAGRVAAAAGEFSKKNLPSANTGSSRWRTTPREICLDCTR